MQQASQGQGTSRSPGQPPSLSRREFLARGSAVAATSALAGVTIPWVHAAEDSTIRLALIGCGGRGSGAVADAFDSPKGPVKLAVMADLFQNRLDSAWQVLSEKFKDGVDVPPDRRFVGFDAYRKAIDCLRPGDVAMLTGYSAFRPMQLEYAVEKGINVFMEKSFAPDAPGLRRLMKAGEAAEKKNLKIADQMMASDFQLCPNIDQLTADSPPPILPDAQGRYPVPVPGQWTEV